MRKEETGKGWRGISEEIIVGMSEWRQQNPKATFEGIEEELDRRLADIAMASASAEWETGSEAPVCPNCGAKLERSGKKKRKLQTRGGRAVELEREYGVCPKCRQGIFPPG